MAANTQGFVRGIKGTRQGSEMDALRDRVGHQKNQETGSARAGPKGQTVRADISIKGGRGKRRGYGAGYQREQNPGFEHQTGREGSLR